MFEIRTTREELLRALGMVMRAVSAKSIMPILQCALFEADEETGAKLRGTDLEKTISTPLLNAMVTGGAGKFAVPARLLADVLRTLSRDEPVKLSCSTKPRELMLISGRQYATIQLMDADDYPDEPSAPEEELTVWRIDARAFCEGVRRVAYAAATVDHRPVLTGVRLEFDGHDFALAAADGYRLAVYDGKSVVGVDDAVTDAMTVPASAMRELLRLTSDDEMDDCDMIVSMSADRSWAAFEFERLRLTIQLLRGTYASYRDLIPDEHTTRVVVDGGEFTRAVKTASVFAFGADDHVRLRARDGMMRVYSRAADVGDCNTAMDARLECGEELRIAFNCRYLRDALAALSGVGDIAVETMGAESVSALKSASEVEQSTHVHVLMPVRVSWEDEDGA